MIANADVLLRRGYSWCSSMLSLCRCALWASVLAAGVVVADVCRATCVAVFERHAPRCMNHDSRRPRAICSYIVTRPAINREWHRPTSMIITSRIVSQAATFTNQDSHRKFNRPTFQTASSPERPLHESQQPSRI